MSKENKVATGQGSDKKKTEHSYNTIQPSNSQMVAFPALSLITEAIMIKNKNTSSLRSKGSGCKFTVEQPPLPFPDLILSTEVFEIKIKHCRGVDNPDFCKKCPLTISIGGRVK